MPPACQVACLQPPPLPQGSPSPDSIESKQSETVYTQAAYPPPYHFYRETGDKGRALSCVRAMCLKRQRLHIEPCSNTPTMPSPPCGLCAASPFMSQATLAQQRQQYQQQQQCAARHSAGARPSDAATLPLQQAPLSPATPRARQRLHAQQDEIIGPPEARAARTASSCGSGSKGGLMRFLRWLARTWCCSCVWTSGAAVGSEVTHAVMNKV